MPGRQVGQVYVGSGVSGVQGPETGLYALLKGAFTRRAAPQRHEARQIPQIRYIASSRLRRSGTQRRRRERYKPLPCCVAYRDHQRRVLLDRAFGIRAKSHGIKCIRFAATRRGLDFTGGLLRATRQKCWALPGSVASSFPPGLYRVRELDFTGAS